MQILPAKQSFLGDQLFATAGQTADDDSFSQEMLRQQAAQAAQSAPVSAAENTSAPKEAPKADTEDTRTTAPYSRNTADGVVYSLQEVVFTKQELQDLYRKLHDKGATAESLSGLAALLELPDGASLSQVLNSLKSNRTAAKLEEAEEKALKNLLDKISSDSTLSAHIQSLLQDGKTQEAWQHISRALQSMPPESTITVDRSDILLLGKALGLSDATRQQMLSNFGPYSSLNMSGRQLDAVLGPAQHEFNERLQNQSTLDKALDATLTPMLKKARERMEAEKSASERSSRRSEQSKVLIERTVMRNVNDALHTAVAGEAAKATPQQAQDVQNAATPKNTAHDPAAAKHASPQHDDSITKDSRAPKDNREGSETPFGKARDSWDALLSKTESRMESAPAGAAGVVFDANPAQTTNAAASAAQARPGVSTQALSQVEQALLSALRDGTKRLDIQLDPVDLGTLSLTLVSRNGEVSATIRSGRSETAEMIGRQLDVLRTNLEQQGIKVDKLEVHNHAADQRNTSWESMQQHNARQEEYARRETLDRWRNLGRWRNDSDSIEGTHLEQGMQSIAHTAENATGIYLVA